MRRSLSYGVTSRLETAQFPFGKYNLVGTIIVCKTFVLPMRERGHGVVINLASAAAHPGVSDGAICGVLKAAVAHYTRCLAEELIKRRRAG